MDWWQGRTRSRSKITPKMCTMIIAIAGLLALLVTDTAALSLPQLLPLGTNKAVTSTSWRLLYQNDGDWTDKSKPSFLLSGTTATQQQASAVCSSVSEKLAPASDPLDDGLVRQLAYLVYDGSYPGAQNFWVADGKAVIVTSKGTAKVSSVTPSADTKLPVLCTQSAKRTSANETDTSSAYAITTGPFTGYRDGRSFRFGGVPYATSVQRFAQSTVNDEQEDITADLTNRSKQCPQRAGTDQPFTEDCLVLNVYTPAIGKAQSNTGRPIMVWVHGGGFTSGSGLDFTFDGGELASRSDVVVVTPNYRLGSLGFLSINDESPGNYGVNDVITALRWVKNNAAFFGGDASRVLLFGQSAGAQIVEALLGSPKAEGLFTSAIVQSGRPQDRANALLTAEKAQATSSGDVIKALGCSGAADVLACLRQVPTDRFLDVKQFAKPVVDGDIITSDSLDVAGKQGGHINDVPVIFGFMRDETASLGYVPPKGTSLDTALSKASLSTAQQNAVKENQDDFPGNTVQNTTVTAATDATSIKRCGQESTLLAAAQSGQFSAVYGYTQNQRAMQILNFDPNAVCQSSDPSKPYYFCHSGDLLPTFASAGYAYNLAPRDNDDIVWTNLQLDQWSSFARHGHPTPSADYLSVRGYTSTADALKRQDGSWQQVLGTSSTSASTARIMSLGPAQHMVTLRQNGQQCDLLGLPIDYVSQGK